MILKYNDLEIQSNHLTFEKRFKYSNNLSFIPIKYNNTDLLIQTPVLFVPFNISAYSKECNKKYLTLSFQSCCNEDFINNLDYVITLCKEEVCPVVPEAECRMSCCSRGRISL